MAAMLSAILDCPDTKQQYPIWNLYKHYPYPKVYWGEKLIAVIMLLEYYLQSV